MEPRGATEIQMEMLQKYVAKEILDQVQKYVTNNLATG